MKTLKLILALCAISLMAEAQPFTGMTLYDHNGDNAQLSSGNTCAVHTNGFVMGGYKPVTITGSYNFFIDKTDNQGIFTTPNDFQNGYMFFAGMGCTATTPQQLTCQGVSVIETNAASNLDSYVMAASFNSGCVISGLDIMGNITSTLFYFNYPSSATQPSKPLIAESTINPGVYYVCGSYFDTASSSRIMYAFQVDNAGSLNWSNIYDLGLSTVLEPKAIIESPYTPASSPELVVVGIANPNLATLGIEGFMMNLDGTIAGGGVTSFQLYGTGQNIDEFHSIAPAPLASVPGFIVGGYTNTSPLGTAWMILLDSGGGITWSSMVALASSTTGGPVVGVIERFSGFYGTTEYYGTIPTSAGSIVAKLDDFGMPFGASLNEFVYNPNAVAGYTSKPAAITYFDIGGGSNDGIHVYGTDRTNAVGTGEFYLTLAYFNGASGTCNSPTEQNLTNLSSVTALTNLQTTLFVNVNPGLNLCSSFNLTSTSNPYGPNQLCPTNFVPAAPYAGDNSKTMTATGIGSPEKQNSRITVQPNPFHDKFTIHYFTSSQTHVQAEVFNALGQLVKSVAQSAVEGENQLGIDFSQLQLESGVYTVRTNINGSSQQQKIIYVK